jgi:drug/metabolite transporter (DMT)-like permease
MTADRSPPLLLYGSFAAVYLVWGSSFAVTKYVVSHLPWMLAGATRFIVAGVLLTVVARLRGAALPRERREWRHFAVMGTLHVFLSAGLNLLAMRHIASNQSALLNASAALWIPLLGALGRRGHPLGVRESCGLVLGFGGVAFLLWPKGGFSFANLGWQLVAILACLCWAVGTVYHRRSRSRTPTLMFVALEMLIGGALLGVLGVGLGELPQWQPTPASLVALGYLMLFSSCLAYTAFGYLMTHTTPARLSTYAYVNPAIAAVVGWALLGERMTPVQIAGTAIILGGVVLVSLPGSAPGAPATPAEQPG